LARAEGKAGLEGGLIGIADGGVLIIEIRRVHIEFRDLAR
jgi:hypothetical protein